MRYLEGKFFLRNEEDTYRTGVVVKVAKGMALVAYDNMVKPDAAWSMPLELVCCHDEMAHGETSMGKMWGFFNSREELDGYLKWMETPQQPGQQVVKLVPKKP